MIWNKFLRCVHVYIVEEEDKRGTLEIELVAKEEKRRDKKNKQEGNSLMMMSFDDVHITLAFYLVTTMNPLVLR